jgi:hypothetical protein
MKRICAVFLSVFGLFSHGGAGEAHAADHPLYEAFQKRFATAREITSTDIASFSAPIHVFECSAATSPSTQITHDIQLRFQPPSPSVSWEIWNGNDDEEFKANCISSSNELWCNGLKMPHLGLSYGDLHLRMDYSAANVPILLLEARQGSRSTAFAICERTMLTLHAELAIIMQQVFETAQEILPGQLGSGNLWKPCEALNNHSYILGASVFSTSSSGELWVDWRYPRLPAANCLSYGREMICPDSTRLPVSVRMNSDGTLIYRKPTSDPANDTDTYGFCIR